MLKCVDVEDTKQRLDIDINEAAVQLIGHFDSKYDRPLIRFVMLCAARAEFENEGVVGTEPEQQWVQIARDAYVSAAQHKAHKKDHHPLPHLLSDTPSGITSQQEWYEVMTSNLVIANTDEDPEIHYGQDFAAQVAEGTIQVRYV